MEEQPPKLAVRMAGAGHCVGEQGLRIPLRERSYSSVSWRAPSSAVQRCLLSKAMFVSLVHDGAVSAVAES